MYALDGVLADDHYQCWHIFVKACRLLIQSKLTEIEVRLAHLHLIEFCSTFHQLYGAENCTQNMHMACHRADCVLDYGVLSSFWCFPFERLNGTLDGMKKSWILPEKKFIMYNNLQRFLFVDSTRTDIGEFLGILCQENLLYQHNQAGSSSVDQSTCDDNISSTIMKNNHCSITDIMRVKTIIAAEAISLLASPLTVIT